MTSTESRLRILIADDHPLMRDGLRVAIERERDMVVVGEAGDGAQTIAMFTELRPDAVLMDLQMPTSMGCRLSPRYVPWLRMHSWSCLQPIRAMFERHVRSPWVRNPIS